MGLAEIVANLDSGHCVSQLSISRSSLTFNALLHISDEEPNSIFVKLLLLMQSQILIFRVLKLSISS